MGFICGYILGVALGPELGVAAIGLMMIAGSVVLTTIFTATLCRKGWEVLRALREKA